MNTADFAPTGLRLSIEGDFPRAVSIPSNLAKRWDCALPETNCTVRSERYGFEAYAQLRITGRAPRTHKGGVYGMAAKVRFTGSEEEGGEWISCVVLNGGM